MDIKDVVKKSIEIKMNLNPVITFTDRDIIECKITEEINPISSTLPINICDITIYSEDDKFNILNSSSLYNNLEKNIRFDIYGILYNNNNESERVYFGKYYLDTWDCTHKHEARFHLISILGVLDKYVIANNPLIYLSDKDIIHFTADTVLYVLLNRMDNTYIPQKLLNYEADNYLNDKYIWGVLPISSYKSILQLIAFTVNCIVDDTRNTGAEIDIKVYHRSDIPEFIIDKDILFEPINIKVNDIITGLNIKVNYYAPNNFIFTFDSNTNAILSIDTKNYSTISDIPINSSGKVPAGTVYKFKSDKAISRLTVILYTDNTKKVLSEYLQYTYTNVIPRIFSNNSATIYAIDNTTSEITFKQEGYYDVFYSSPDIINSVIVEKIFNNEYLSKQKNHLSIDNDPILFPIDSTGHRFDNALNGQVETFANDLEDYYSEAKLKLEFDCINIGNLKTGAYGLVYTGYDKYIPGYITKQVIDLTGGFISHVTMICNDNLTEKYYALHDEPYDLRCGNYSVDNVTTDDILI